MAILSVQHSCLFTFGILGNIVSFMVYLAPVPTFYKIVKKKSAEGFQSLPYLVALFSSMLWIYYASFKSDAYLLISINFVGCVIETIYIALYVSYAPKKARVTTLVILLLKLGGFFLIAVLSYFLAKGPSRVQVLGWICLTFSVCVFAAPLSIMRQVIRTKSVEFMPFPLSFFLTLNAVIWFFYGLLQKDYYIALPNILGFFFGLVQMALYLIYKNYPEVIPEDQKLPTAVKLEGAAAKTVEVYPVFTEGKEDPNPHDKRDNDDESTADASNQV